MEFLALLYGCCSFSPSSGPQWTLGALFCEHFGRVHGIELQESVAPEDVHNPASPHLTLISVSAT